MYGNSRRGRVYFSGLGDAMYPSITDAQEQQIASAVRGGAAPGNLAVNFGISSDAAQYFYDKYKNSASSSGGFFEGLTSGLKAITPIASTAVASGLVPGVPQNVQTALAPRPAVVQQSSGMSTGLMVAAGAGALLLLALVLKK